MSGQGIVASSLAHELLPLGIRVNGIAPGMALFMIYLHSLT